MSNEGSSSLNRQLVALTASRLLINSALRLTYPFLPALARGLGVSLAAVARLVALRAFVGFLSPLLSPLSERFGRRPVLVGSMVLFVLGAFVVVIWPAYWGLGVTLVVCSGLVKVLFDPAMQAYLGDVVPYTRRGWAIAVTEFSWAGAMLLGAPLFGFVIARQGWQAPFFWLGLLGIFAVFALWRVLPHARTHSTEASDLRAVGRVLRRYPVVWATAGYMLLVIGANELLLIVYGQWMEQSFSLSLTNLGVATTVLGLAEISGELFAGWAVDHLGKRPVVITTGLLAGLIYLAVPYTGTSLAAALATLFLVFVAFEATVVGSMPLLTEVLPAARSVVLSTVLAAASLGRMLGALIGPGIWQAGGLPANTLLAAVVTWAGIFVLARWVHEGETQPAPAEG